MTIPDVGGRAGAGRPPQLTPQELQQTAGEQVARLGLGIMPNTLEVMFTEIGGNVFKYTAHSSKPALPLYISTVTTHPDNEGPSTEEKEEYSKLFDELPLKIKERMRAQKGQAREDQDPLCIIFDQVLRFAAKAMVWLTKVSEISPIAFQEVNEMHKALPQDAFDKGLQLCRDLFEHLKKLKPQIEADWGLREVVKNNQEVLSLLLKLGQEAKSIEGLQVMLKTLLTLRDRFEQRRMPNILQMIADLIDCFIDKTAALIVGPNVSSLFSSLLASSVWTASSPKHGAILGNNLHQVLQWMTNQNAEVNEANRIFMNLIAHLVPMVLTSLVVVGSGIWGWGFGASQDLENYVDFALTLSLNLIAYSELPTVFIQQLYELLQLDPVSCGLNEEGLLAITLNQILLAGAGFGNNSLMSSSKEMVFGLRGFLMMHARSLIEKLDLIESTASGPVKVAVLALEKGDITTYFQTINDWLKTRGLKGLEFQYESERFLRDAVTWTQGIYEALGKSSGTTVVNQGV